MPRSLRLNAERLTTWKWNDRGFKSPASRRFFTRNIGWILLLLLSFVLYDNVCVRDTCCICGKYTGSNKIPLKSERCEGSLPFESHDPGAEVRHHDGHVRQRDQVWNEPVARKKTKESIQPQIWPLQVRNPASIGPNNQSSNPGSWKIRSYKPKESRRGAVAELSKALHCEGK